VLLRICYCYYCVMSYYGFAYLDSPIWLCYPVGKYILCWSRVICCYCFDCSYFYCCCCCITRAEKLYSLRGSATELVPYSCASYLTSCLRKPGFGLICLRFYLANHKAFSRSQFFFLIKYERITVALLLTPAKQCTSTDVYLRCCSMNCYAFSKC